MPFTDRSLAILPFYIVSSSTTTTSCPPVRRVVPPATSQALSLETNLEASRAYTRHLFLSDDDTFRYLFRMEKAVFWALCQWIRLNTTARDGRYVSLELKVMIFVWILALGETQRNAASFFRVSQTTICRIFHQLTDPFRTLHVCFVRRSTALSTTVELDERFLQFSGVNAAIDGTHVNSYIPGPHQARWRDRRREIPQNVLAEVDLDNLLFTFVLAGAEGSIHDASLLRIASAEGFYETQRNRLVLGDAGFGARQGLLLPYPGRIYHLDDFRRRNFMPQDEQELYNLRHAQLRSRVEQAFGRLKRKFKILRTSPPEYNIYNQQLIIYATTGLYNFIVTGGMHLDAFRRQRRQELSEAEEDAMEAARQRVEGILPHHSGTEMRAKITSWLQYQDLSREEFDESIAVAGQQTDDEGGGDVEGGDDVE